MHIIFLTQSNYQQHLLTSIKIESAHDAGNGFGLISLLHQCVCFILLL